MKKIDARFISLDAGEVRYLAAVVRATRGDEGAKAYINEFSEPPSRLIDIGFIEVVAWGAEGEVATEHGIAWYDAVFGGES